jgi:hypothetical protein
MTGHPFAHGGRSSRSARAAPDDGSVAGHDVERATRRRPFVTARLDQLRRPPVTPASRPFVTEGSWRTPVDTPVADHARMSRPVSRIRIRECPPTTAAWYA